MNRRQWIVLSLVVGIPLLLGMVIRLVLASGVLPNPVIKLTADLGTLAFLCGASLALLLGGLIWLIIWQDRTYRHSLLQVQAEANADRRRFLQRLDHELKNPLTAIQAGLANLNEASDLQALESVKAQSLRLNRLVSDLRKLADLETRPLEHAPVDLGEILHAVIDLAQEDPRSEGREIDLTLPQAPWPLPPVIGDDDLLMLAMHNLMDNALKFSQPGDRIEARAFEDGSAVVVEIADTGAGIPADELPHVWEELYRGKGARGVQGSGLGMALVRAIIERHGGSVTLRSRLNQGTVVTARLPLGAERNPT
jgi:signal transduction histidine kinase